MQVYAPLINVLTQPGAVAVIPTDTVYGLAARATDNAAVARLYDLKPGRAKPGTVIAASLEQLISLGLKARYLKAVADFWPGPVSVIIPAADPALDYLTLGKGGLAVRIPKLTDLTKLLGATGPLLTSSANLTGQPPATNLGEAKAYFGERVDYYHDGGDLSGHQASTIIRIVDDAIEVVRQGEVRVAPNG